MNDDLCEVCHYRKTSCCCRLEALSKATQTELEAAHRETQIWQSVAERIGKEFGLVGIHPPHEVEKTVISRIRELRQCVRVLTRSNG